jgi:hypothetical protein
MNIDVYEQQQVHLKYTAGVRKDEIKTCAYKHLPNSLFVIFYLSLFLLFTVKDKDKNNTVTC